MTTTRSAAATQPETRGIELIDEGARRGRPSELLFVWAAPSVSILSLTVGATLILLGLELWQAVLLAIGSSIMSIFMGIIAVSGPAAGTSGSIISRAIYGVIGNRVIVACTGWLIASVFLALNWLGSSFLGAGLLESMGLAAGPWGVIAITLVVSTVTIGVAVYGHALIVRIYPAISIGLVVIFVAVAAFVLPHADWGYQPAEPLSGVALWSALTIGGTLLASGPLSYINSPDMSRYLPSDASRPAIIAATSIGAAAPAVVFTIVGALLATGVGSAVMDAGIESALLGLLPMWLVPVFVIGVIVNTVALNGMTTYTASMALQAIGLPIRRIPAAVIVGVIGTALTLYLVTASSLLEAVNLMLQFLMIVSAPTMAIFAIDVVLRRGRYDGVELFDESSTSRFWYQRGWGLPGIIAVTVGGVAAAACLTTTVWSGPVATAMSGIDLSVPAGMLVSAGLYVWLQRTSLGERGRP